MSESASQKAYLIDATQLARLIRPKQENLNTKMTEVAQDSQAPAAKFYEYSKLYNKYFDKISEDKKPIIIKETLNRAENSPTAITSPLRKLTEIIPKSYADKAFLLYHKLSKSPDLKWDETNVYLNGQVITKLNIMELLKLFTSRKKIKDIEGYDTFQKYVTNFLLHEDDVDKSLLNETLSNSMQTDQSGNGWLQYDF